MSGVHPASSRVPRTATGQFVPGVGGNPAGRPPAKYDLPAMCRAHTPKAVQKLAEMLDDEDGRLRFMAAKELLDRGWGRAVQPVADQTTGESLQLMHLLAAQHVATLVKAQVVPGQTVEATAIDYTQPALE